MITAPANGLVAPCYAAVRHLSGRPDAKVARAIATQPEPVPAEIGRPGSSIEYPAVSTAKPKAELYFEVSY